MKATDELLEQMEAHLREIYETASKETTEAWKEYMTEQGKKIADLQKQYDAAKKAGDKKLQRRIGIQLAREKREMTFQNERYQRLVKDFTAQMTKANRTALAYLNGKMPSIYAYGANEAKADAEKVGMSFTIVDEATVKRLAMQDEIKLPYKKIDAIKDRRWNTRQLNSSVLQGILQGEPMSKIAERIMPIVGNNEAAAMRNARTMVTGAENGGRYDRARWLEEEGAVIEKEWSAAVHSSRTREWHRDRDGMTIPNDEEFAPGLMYPGDPGGEPEEVYNCRCSMITHIVAVNINGKRIKF